MKKIITFLFITISMQVHSIDKLYINNRFQNHSLSIEQNAEFTLLTSSLSQPVSEPSDFLKFYYVLKEVDITSGMITLEDGSKFLIGWWYRGPLSQWKQGNRLKITLYDYKAANPYLIENIDVPGSVYGVVESYAKILLFITKFIDNDYPLSSARIVLDGDFVFECTDLTHKDLLENNWAVRNPVLILHSENKYKLLNVRTSKLFSYEWKIVGRINQQIQTPKPVSFEEVITLEKRLNDRVLAQTEATRGVANSIINYSSGLKDPKGPIGVFLFLGPTGVGKTELAKALALEHLKDLSFLTRFDMSHFSDKHSVARLIGSPPGYIDHDEGGQLTNALISKPQSIVLLDEIEKAAPEVRKFFLPILDEGYVNDSNNKTVECKDVIFIMTSNLCAIEIAELFNAGYTSEEILKIIEPSLIAALSPELYNRVEPIAFHPLNKVVMSPLVNLMLKEIQSRMKITKDIDLIIDDNAKEYLAINGFHPSLGARPLKKLIQKTVVSNIAYAIIRDGIPNGSVVKVSYDKTDESWHITWEKRDL